MAKEKREGRLHEILERFQASVRNGPILPLCMDDWFDGNCPFLWTLLASMSHPDGKPRQPGRLTIRIIGGAFKVTFYDEECNVQCHGSDEMLQNALLQIEKHLAEGKPMEPGWKPRKRS